MRIAELSLERYGRFEDCRLNFPRRERDLHLVYGANEAGKSTTLEAVTDLLFGIDRRSPYNFRFPYPLMRIGCVLESEAGPFACRRRKGQSQTLVDADDRPIDEAPLRALLLGHEREGFQRAFSLDQTRLRAGGQAMSQAKDDLGQALFAAGSGLTEVSQVLRDLAAEADAVWGPRAAQRRGYTAAERQLHDAQSRLREAQLRPRAWTDARQAMERAIEAREALESEAANLVAERHRLERLRRIGPDARQHEALRAALSETTPAPGLTAHDEAAAEIALGELDRADRAIAAATTLLDELEQRMAVQPVDEAVVGAGAAIEALAERRGAELKAAADLVLRRSEVAERMARATQLRAEAGAAEMASRITVARLRDLAQQDSALRGRLSELHAAITDAEGRAGPLKTELAAAELDEGLPELTTAVEAARLLGAEADAHCDAQARDAARLKGAADDALARLAPWSGDATALSRLVEAAPEEIDAAHAAAGRARDEAAAADLDARKAEKDLADLALERQALAEGAAVAPEKLAAARDRRDREWNALRIQLRIPEPAPEGALDSFEDRVREADALADSRFASAADSGRLAALDARAERLQLTLAQAETASGRARDAETAAAEAWTARLTSAGLPSLEPLRFRAWAALRREALDAVATAATAAEAAQAGLRRRESARARLLAALPVPMRSGAEADFRLAPALEAANRLREAGEARSRRFTEARAELRSLEQQLANHTRAEARTRAEREKVLAEWDQVRGESALELPIEGAEARLALLDELRGVLDEIAGLERRIEGIERDARTFAADVAAICDPLNQAADDDPHRRLGAIRDRLAVARSAADARRENETLRGRLQQDLRDAQAKRDAASASLAPRLAELGVAEVVNLPARLEAGRAERRLREDLAETERRLAAAGDGYGVDELLDAFAQEDPDALADRLHRLDADLNALNARVAEAAEAAGSARQTAEALETGPGAAVAAEEAAQARAELENQAELYLLKRTQGVVLRWALDRYRERRQNPLLARASELFHLLTLGRYAELRIDVEEATPCLLGLREDGASLVQVDQMSEGTSDQLFLALRLAAVEQTIASGARLPFFADDLFVNFDDARATAGLRALSELSRSTQVIVFTHHAHLRTLAREALGIEVLSECELA